MCGIVGIVNGSRVSEGLVSGLRNLEYRGYDSAGIAVLSPDGLHYRRALGKIAELGHKLNGSPIEGAVGIGHTRWATHGAPSEINAHPHIVDGIAVVHNGIIENFRELRQELEETGFTFSSETDSEVVPALIAANCKAGMSPTDAIRGALNRLDGQYALAVVMEDQPDVAFAARNESPLAIGINNKEALIASDMLAFSGRAQREMQLENGDIATIRRHRIDVIDRDSNQVDRPLMICRHTKVAVDKGIHRHFMIKEIHEQPQTIIECLDSLSVLDDNPGLVLPESLSNCSRFTAVACGTSFYAGMVARPWFEQLAGIPLDLEIASEFRYRSLPIGKGEGALFISQSGETADTLASLRRAKDEGAPIGAIVNVPTSAMAREADLVVQTIAGPEIGVASTKAFTAQLAALLSIAIAMGRARGRIDDNFADDIMKSLYLLPEKLVATLAQEAAIRAVAQSIKNATSTVFVGRGACHGLAMEGALKLKEISYIHAEGFAAGELKHGPIALIDEAVPAIVLAPHDKHFSKTISNAQEIAARAGRLVTFSDAEGCAALTAESEHSIVLPETDSVAAPFVYAVALQLLAYHTAVAKGTDVDQPRNLAKSVTVE